MVTVYAAENILCKFKDKRQWKQEPIVIIQWKMVLD